MALEFSSLISGLPEQIFLLKYQGIVSFFFFITTQEKLIFYLYTGKTIAVKNIQKHNGFSNVLRRIFRNIVNIANQSSHSRRVAD